MPEQFKPEVRLSSGDAEEAKFWDDEITEYLKTASDSIKKMPRERIIDDLMNNLELKFRLRGKLDPEFMTPEQYQAAQRISADIERYLDEHSLHDEYQKIAAEQDRRAKIFAEATRNMNLEMIKNMKWEVPQAEVRDFYKKAYRALRQKGYSHKEIAE
jgi:uncharacterized protein (UPF0297 family)